MNQQPPARLDRSGWLVALLLLIIGAALLGLAAWAVAGALGLSVESPGQLGLALLVAVVPFLPFWLLVCGLCFAPMLRLTGALRYCSPSLIVTRTDRGRLVLHGAMAFDYLRLFRWRDRGRPAVRRILLWYVEGLVHLSREVRQGRIPVATELSAVSYIVSEHTLRRYGFTVEHAPRLVLGGILTYPTQFLTWSFARGRWALPPIHRACRGTIRAEQLGAKLDELMALQNRLRLACGEQQ